MCATPETPPSSGETGQDCAPGSTPSLEGSTTLQLFLDHTAVFYSGVKPFLNNSFVLHLPRVYPAPRREPGRGTVWEVRNGGREWKKKWGEFVRTGVGGGDGPGPQELRPDQAPAWACSETRRSLPQQPGLAPAEAGPRALRALVCLSSAGSKALSHPGRPFLFLWIFFKLEYNTHYTKFATLAICNCSNSVELRTFTMWCEHHHYPCPELLPHPRHSIASWNSPIPPSQPLAAPVFKLQ